ncbi:DUF4145 domain-containing protein [Leeuwenhoekiella nanhaiensis]|uniref:DUF4145 domain-containing protein n=1 Tax=Leeuwenhoekiella nanhaiensis TaxID=1655491 RepID=A0A2G1VU99_9FLAO|nr:DUF4145 domain-containing protein [Leeuwenhoekiella nanhaiensis]PHQ30180.1 hypothetical protein CJ305_04245 [Leeuwenhoekiella nanhaiensis]
MKPFSWTCPHCNSPTTINNHDFHSTKSTLDISNTNGYRSLEVVWIVCPSQRCKKISLYIDIYEAVKSSLHSGYDRGSFIKTWTLLPDTNAKVFPEYIPLAIRNDYEEAHAILELSPKASATLSRRCIEGMIRDFWNVKENSLYKSINAIENRVDPLTWKAIDSVRKVGNIGAHMEKDINLIIDVEPNEAKLLIGLIELLLEEWYIHRHEREQKLNSIIAIADDKEENRKKD